MKDKLKNFNNIPGELKKLNRWVNWKLQKTDKGKFTKIPVNPNNGSNADVTNSNTWASYDTAIKKASNYDGIGFILGNGYIGIDLDNIDVEIEEYKQGKTDNIVAEFINQLGSYSEYSQSGKGIHIILKGDSLPGKRNRKNNIEMYSDNRYFIFTGDLASGFTEIINNDEMVKKLYSKYLKEEEKEKPLFPQSKNNNNIVELADDEVLDIMFNSKERDKLIDLYTGNWEKHFSSQSEADQSLCNTLAFYTGKNFNQIDSIFINSNLYRKKWDRKDYKERTINKAINDTNNVYYKYEQIKKPTGIGRQIKRLDDYYSYSNYITKVEGFKQFYEIPNKTNGNISVNPGLLTNHILNNIPMIRVTGNIYLYDKGVYKLQEFNSHKSIVKDHISIEKQTISMVNNVSGMLEIDSSIQKKPNDINNNPYIINVKNGLYNLETKKLEKHTFKYASTVQIKANYNPKAKGKVFEKFINEIVPNEDTRKVVQEMLGYSISGFNNAKKAFILLGGTDTGKSTLLNLISDLVGIKNISTVPFQQLGGKFSTALLYGKTANICADLSNIAMEDDSVFKQLTGGDMVEGEFKGKDGFTFENKAKLVFSTNELPQNYGDRSGAYYNRLILIPIDQQIPKEKQDTNLNEKLTNEIDYIFMWALKGLERLISNNMIFTQSKEVDQQMKDYKISKVDNTLEVIKDMMDLGLLVEHYHYKYSDDNLELALYTIPIYKEILSYTKQYLSPGESRAIYLKRKEFQEAIQKEDYFIDYKYVRGIQKTNKKCYVIQNKNYNVSEIV